MIVATANKAASSQNDVIERAAVNGDLQKSIIEGNCGTALFQVVVLPEDQLRIGSIGYGRRVQFLVATHCRIIDECRIG